MTRVAGVRLRLPASWSLRQSLDVDGARDDELVLVVSPTVEDVAVLDRHLLRRPQLVVLIDESWPATSCVPAPTGADLRPARSVRNVIPPNVPDR